MPTLPTFFERGDEAKIAWLRTNYENKQKYKEKLNIWEGRVDTLDVVLSFVGTGLLILGPVVLSSVRSGLVFSKYDEDINENLTHAHLVISFVLTLFLGFAKAFENAYQSAIVKSRMVFSDDFFKKHLDENIWTTQRNLVMPVEEVTTIPSIGDVGGDEKVHWIRNNKFVSRDHFEVTVNKWDVNQQQYNSALKISLSLMLMFDGLFSAIQSGFYRGVKAKDHDMDKKNIEFKDRDGFMGTQLAINAILCITCAFLLFKRRKPKGNLEKAIKSFTPDFFVKNPDLFTRTDQPPNGIGGTALQADDNGGATATGADENTLSEGVPPVVTEPIPTNETASHNAALIR